MLFIVPTLHNGVKALIEYCFLKFPTLTKYFGGFLLVSKTFPGFPSLGVVKTISTVSPNLPIKNNHEFEILLRQVNIVKKIEEKETS